MGSPAMHACDRCHRRKSKCDKLLPSCGPCEKVGVACVYTDRSKEPTVRREVVERLERRLRQTETTNRALAARLAAATATVTATPPATNIDSSHRGSQTSPSSDPEGDEHQIGRELAGNEVMDEVSFLSLNAGGERHFLGSASGVLFANLVKATVEATSSNGWKRPFRERCDSIANAPSVPSLSSSSTAPIERSSLPPEKVARDLHRAYFDHDHLSYPFLHRAFALTALEQIYADPSALERDAFTSFQFDMILAVATASVHKFDLQSLPEAESYQARATFRLNEVLQAGGVQALQAVLLLCQYRMTDSIQDTSASMWHIVGVAVRMCFELGLHREQVYRPRRIPGAAELAPDYIIQNEIGRRCFWCVVAMDRIVSITLGRPLAIRLEDVDTALPDPDIDAAVNYYQGDVDDRTASYFSRTSLFVHIVRYRILCGKILASLHSGPARTSADEASALTSRDTLAIELEEWRRDATSLNLPAVDLSSALPGDRSSYRAREWYEMIYYNALLMLYRPSPVLSSISSRDPAVLQTIFVAAKQAITLYAHLHRSRRINYTWITLHAVFMAGLSYLYSVGRHFRSRKRNAAGANISVFLDNDPSIMEIVNESRACSNVLVAVSERWNAPRHCHEVFDRLSDAVLADAIDFHTKKPPVVASRTGADISDTPSNISSVHDTNLDGWSFTGTVPTPLAVDSVLRDCFDDLQHFHAYGCGDDPIGQLSQDWLGEIDSMTQMDAVRMWGDQMA